MKAFRKAEEEGKVKERKEKYRKMAEKVLEESVEVKDDTGFTGASGSRV